MIKHILCPIDHSPSSLQAFNYAIALARWQGARLHVLEVVETVTSSGSGVSRSPKHAGVALDTRATIERDLRAMLVARRASDVKVEIVIRNGRVAREILAYARASQSDLIVIGSHGRGAVRRVVLGSVAETVLRQAPCPVLTVKSGVRRTRRRGSPFQTILCPTDFSAAGNKAVAYAKRLAREADATLVMMSAIEWPFGAAVALGPVAKWQEALEENARKALRRLLPPPSPDRPAAIAVVVQGDASAAIIKLARARVPDLVVMSVSGRGAQDVVLLGSTTHHVIRQGTWPVLSVPPGRR